MPNRENLCVFPTYKHTHTHICTHISFKIKHLGKYTPHSRVTSRKLHGKGGGCQIVSLSFMEIPNGLFVSHNHILLLTRRFF